MAHASVGKAMKHSSMLDETGCLWTIGVEPNVRTYVPCPEHEGDAPLSCGNNGVARLIFVLFDVDQRRAKLVTLHRQISQVTRSE
ncbi:unnamed protein product, partial [Rotaria sp. Silwood2]